MPTSLKRAIETYLKLDLSVYTLRTYRSRLNAFLAFIGDRPLESISYADLVDYCFSFKSRLKPSSVFHYQIVLKTFFKWCVEVGYLAVSPADLLKVHRVDPEPVERAIPAWVLDAVYQAAHEKRQNAVRDYAIIRLIDESACRRVGVANLRIAQLDLENMSAVTKEKGGRHVPIYFGPEAARALRSWLALRPGTHFDQQLQAYRSTLSHDYVFTSRNGDHPPLKPEAISAMIRRLTSTVSPRGYGPHSIRHYAAEEMVEAGEASNVVQHKLNHRHQRTTIDAYYPTDNSLVQLATLRRMARRSSSRNKPARIIPLFDEGESSG